MAIAGMLLGGWAVPLGFLLDLSAVEVYVAAAAGGIAGCWGCILLGDRIVSRIDRRHDGESTSNDVRAGEATGRVRRLVERFGIRGLGIVGPIFPGVTASVIAGLALGLPRRQLGRSMTIGISIMYGLYTAGIAVIVHST